MKEPIVFNHSGMILALNVTDTRKNEKNPGFVTRFKEVQNCWVEIFWRLVAGALIFAMFMAVTDAFIESGKEERDAC